MATLLTSALIDRCHAGSRAKGFWDETPHPGQQLMLVISELAEALEADRKNRRADLHDFNLFAASSPELPQDERRAIETKAFLENAKDTVEDELADAYIRLCDFIGGFGLDKDIIIEGVEYDRSHRVEPLAYTGNMGADLLAVTAWVVAIDNAAREDDGSDFPFAELPMRGAIVALEEICELAQIDLATHIDLKLRYNATRPAKHGKAY
jgi:hypothetical protein